MLDLDQEKWQQHHETAQTCVQEENVSSVSPTNERAANNAKGINA